MRRFVRRRPEEETAREGPPESNARLLGHSRLLVEFPDAPELLIGFAQAQGSDHFTDRNLRIVGPEDPAVLVLVISKAHLIAIFLLERRAIMKLRAPGKNGIAEI